MSDLPLHEVSIFRTLSSEDLGEISQSLRVKVLSPGEMLFKEDEPGYCFYIVIEGELEVIKALGTEEERLLNRIGPGDIVGEMSVLGDGHVRSASVRAMKDTNMFELRRESFEEIIKSRPSAALSIMQKLSDRLRASDETTIADLRKKNQELAKAYEDLKAAQAELIVKEKMEHELEMARKIQMSILPEDVPVPEGCDVGAKMVPARAVGGDFYDIIPLGGGKVGVAIGDVSDKGVPAAMFMAQFCTLLRATAYQNADPGVVLTKVNNFMLDSNRTGMFVTGIYGVYDSETQVFSYARGGHEAPVIFDQSGEITQLPHEQGMALCIFPDPPIDLQSVHIPPGSTLMMYTDGGTDAMNAEENFFGLDNLKETISAWLDSPVQVLCEEVVAALIAYQKEAQFDDVTLVALRTLAG